MTPLTDGARMTASVTARTGGVSIRIQSNAPCARLVRSVFIRSDDNSSDGLGGVLPAVIVFPSSGCALVTMKIFVPASAYFDISDVRSARYDSPKSCGTCDEAS